MQYETATMFDPDYRNGRHRNPDWVTSVKGAASVAYRAGSQKALLLQAYKDAYPNGLTDDEACVAAGLPLTSCYWKRCGELRDDQAIVVGFARPSRHSGEQRIECCYNAERTDDDRNIVSTGATPTSLHQRDWWADRQRLDGKLS